MASLLPARAARAVSCSACRSLVAPVPAQLALPLLRRNYSTPADQAPVDYTDKPRWSYTPPQAKAPFSLRLHSKRREFPVNSDPKALDEFYVRFLGEGGDKVLTEEVKWLAVTHKSFDQGRRGFNDRLAFLGKRVVQLQASLALAQSPADTSNTVTPDRFGREPFAHPALDGLDNLSPNTKKYFTDKLKLAEVARDYELLKVLRWSPRKPDNLATSGVDLILAHTLYALIGAISLEKGGQVANKVARERILAPLGFNVTA
ncbi:ribonuclease-III-like-domain-containing protein [Aspergillus cavernicola]|uniref:Ribonuclease-III-like-domain-containing protein n=1 Tax=Aspergillus cavernicola TaxID=176166 RepID=A0ABR4I8H7_9EURO